MRTPQEVEADLLTIAEALHSLTAKADNIYFIDLQVFADRRRDLMQELRTAEAVQNAK